MDAGLIIKWGKPVPGRENEAFALFGEAMEYYKEKLADRTISYHDTFMYRTGDVEERTGFTILKGEEAALAKVLEDERVRVFLIKGQLVLEHIDVEWVTVGEAAVLQVEQTAKVLAGMALAR